ncbi:HAMP domain-containing sensor histidine kinase [Fulvivirgaceae bacterium BMA12]|uniref:histidine kinase n=1 Tax=Agaribacillus aureus TaxID=3051825 RepID=A0ABT8LHR6_9BACT|nr:HAMP domain-containing sensor histidine kinase [Fulvivirgaceae bacterium BMA12]
MKEFLTNIVNIGIHSTLTNKEIRRIKMLNLFTLVLFILFTSYVIYNLALARADIVMLEASFAMAMLVVILFNGIRKYTVAKMTFFFLINGYLFLSTVFIFPGRMLEYIYFLSALLLLIFFSRPFIIYLFYLGNILLFYLPQVIYKVYPPEVFSYTIPIILFITFFVVMNYFINEQEKYERHISQQNKRLIKLNEEKNQLIGIAAHDLKSPLKRIEGLISLINLSSENLTEEQKGLIEKISHVSKEQNKLILEILDLDKIESQDQQIELKRGNVIKVLDKVMESFRLIARNKDIQITTNYPGDEIYAEIETNYLRQVLENILSNALKFSSANTTVEIEVEIIEDKVRIAIKDQGPGITEDDMKKLFGKFQRLSAQPTGGEVSTGLGLAITKKYVEAMNGTIWCESEFGHGAKFIVEFIHLP